MAIRTPEEYLESKIDDRVIYFKGERVKDVTTHPGIRRLLNVCLADYALALDPQYHDILVAKNEERATGLSRGTPLAEHRIYGPVEGTP